jgi:hypothetical protein
VNAEQASKRAMQEPTQLDLGEGRRRWKGTNERVHRSCRGSGDGMQATGTRRNTGNPSGDREQQGQTSEARALDLTET